MDNDKTVAHGLPTGRGLPTRSTGRRYPLEKTLTKYSFLRLKPLLDLTALRLSLPPDTLVSAVASEVVEIRG